MTPPPPLVPHMEVATASFSTDTDSISLGLISRRSPSNNTLSKTIVLDVLPTMAVRPLFSKLNWGKSAYWL
ncbi:hypothetical protein D3C80_1085710 [compost metagenome]